MAKPTVLPEWASNDVVDGTSGKNNVETPGASYATDGWGFKQRPPRQFFNWLFRHIYNWCAYVDETINQGVKTTDSVQHVDITANNNLIASTGNVVATTGNISAGNNVIAANDITAIDGGVSTVNGDITSSGGDIKTTNGDIISTNGSITATNGNLNATNGGVLAGGNIINGGTITANGTITSVSGNVSTVNGDITSSGGDIITSNGAIEATNGTITAGVHVLASGNVTAGGNISTANGNVTSGIGDLKTTAGDIEATNGRVNGNKIGDDSVDFSSSVTVTGLSAITVGTVTYIKIGKLVIVTFEIAGTGQGDVVSINAPFTAAAFATNALSLVYISSVSEGPGRMYISATTSTIVMNRANASTVFPNGNTISLSGMLIYQAA